MDLIEIPGTKNNRLINPETIIRVEALSNYSRVYFSDGNKKVVAKVLYWFEERLPEQNFARIHRSHLVNKLFIRKINIEHYCTVVLFNGEHISVSRRKKNIIEKILN